MPDDHLDPDAAFAPAEHSPEEDAKENRKKAIREVVIIGVVLFLIFGVFLPQFIDYGQVIDSMMSLTLWQILLLAALGVGRTWFEAGVYNSLIPGLGWWDGWKAWASSKTARPAPLPRANGYCCGGSTGASSRNTCLPTTRPKAVLPCPIPCPKKPS